MTFGVSSTGFLPKRLADVLGELQSAFRAAFGQNVKLDDRSLNGQVNGIFSEQFADFWAHAEKVYVSAYLYGASGAALDELVALAAITRLLATYSEVTLTLTGTNGTVIPINSRSRDALGNRWVHTAPATIAGGTASVVARPENTGAIVGLAGTITTIDTPVSGWTGVTNALDATPGRDVESDAHLRERFVLTMRAGGGSSAEALRAALLRLDDVTEAIVIENNTDVWDSDGRPPHSFESVVRGGDDQEIVDTVWFGKPIGIQTHGNQIGTATDSAGDPQTIRWSRPTTRDIYIIVDITYDDGVLDDARDEIEDAVLDAILDYGNSFTLGQDVVPWKFEQKIETARLADLNLRVGFSANPPASTPLTIERNELGAFDSSRIGFNRIN